MIKTSLSGGCFSCFRVCALHVLDVCSFCKLCALLCATFPAGIYLLKVNNRNTRTRCEIWSKLTIKIPERRQWRRSGIFIVNFEHISHLSCCTVSIINFEHVIAGWDFWGQKAMDGVFLHIIFLQVEYVLIDI